MPNCGYGASSIRIGCCSGSGDIKVAVCIVSFRNSRDIAECLETLRLSTHDAFDVVICENGGTESFDALRKTLPERLGAQQRIQLIEAPENPGYAGGVNRCILASSEADAWWVLNPDARPEPEALAALIHRLERGDVAAVGGTLLYENGLVQAHGGNWQAWRAHTVSIGWGSAADVPVDSNSIERRLSYVLGASMLVGRRFVDTVGLMREDYFLYGEEVEWCLRGIQAGMRLGFAPESRVLHLQGSTTGSSKSVRDRPKLPIYLDQRNKINIVRDTTPAMLPLAIAGAFAMLHYRFALHGAWRQLGYALSGWAAGIADKRGKPAWMTSTTR